MSSLLFLVLYSVLCVLLFDHLIVFFFLITTASSEIYTLSLHDALPISPPFTHAEKRGQTCWPTVQPKFTRDRKSTRLNSSHVAISYAVFCLKKKKEKEIDYIIVKHMYKE